MLLAGSWRGHGEGSYPTIAGFSYTEDLLIVPEPGRPVAHWWSRTRDAYSRESRHAESGFLRGTPEGIELVVAHGFGVVETATGTLGGGVLVLSSYTITGSPTAKRVDAIERRYAFDGNTLHYTISMAAVGFPITHHLRAVLLRAVDE